MKSSINNFIIGRCRGAYYAFRGFFLLIKTEASIQVQSVIGLIMIVLGYYFDISTTEWMFQTLSIGLVLAVEGLNTAVEKLADFIHIEHHPKIGFIKDITAGAVFIAAMTAIVLGLFIYLPKIFS